MINEAFERRPVVECVVGALLVVLGEPAVRELTYIAERAELVGVEQLLAVGPVETLNVGILIGLARLDMLHMHSLLLRPVDKCFSQELGAVVDPQGGR